MTGRKGIANKLEQIKQYQFLFEELVKRLIYSIFPPESRRKNSLKKAIRRKGKET